MTISNDWGELARMCLRQAHVSQTREAADELRRMAREYEDKAARLDRAHRELQKN